MTKPHLTLISVFRYPDITIGQAQWVIRYAKKQVGKKYDLPGAFGSGVTSVSGILLTFAVMGAKGLAAGVAADVLNRKNPEAKFFCFELVAFAYKRGAGIDLGSAPASTTPADLSNLKTLVYIGDLRRKK